MGKIAASASSMAQDLIAAVTELLKLMTAGRWNRPTMLARYTEA